MSLFLNPHLLGVLILSVLIYWRVLKAPELRDGFLFLVSLSVLAFLHPAFAAVSLSLTFFVWTNGKKKSLFLLLSLISSVWLFGKYAFTDLWVAPLGISYLAIKLIQFTMEQKRGLHPNPSFASVGAFLFFFPSLPAGPIESYHSFHSKRVHAFHSEMIGYGLRRMVWGYFKKLFIGELLLDSISRPWVEAVMLGKIETLSPTTILGFAALMFVRAYLDLSAYTDIAIGCARFFGIQLSENFHRPFLKQNLAEFWRGWHMTLARWCRDNVYFPVLAWRRSPALALILSMLFMGLWHQAQWNWILWGCFHGLGLVGLFYLGKVKILQPLLKATFLNPVKYFLTFWYVAIGYLFVSVPNVSRSFALLSRVLNF